MAPDDPISSDVDHPLKIEEAVHSPSIDTLITAADDPMLSEELGLTLLKRSDLPSAVLEQLGKNGSAMKSRKLKLALVEHRRTPRHVSVPLIRSLFTFELMQVALAPVTPADVKIAAEDVLLRRLQTISSGERLSLAHRASGRVAGSLLLDAEARVVQAALENPRLTEAEIVKAVANPTAPPSLMEGLCVHNKWSMRRDIRVALLCNEKTPAPAAKEFALSFSPAYIKELLQTCDLPPDVRSRMAEALQQDELPASTPPED